nr:SpoIIE family protein phosphatase [Motilibacter aurantiacus]
MTPARTQLAALSKAFVDQETGVRGFVVTGAEEFLEPYVAGRREQARLASDLGRLWREDRALSDRLDEVLAAAEDWRQNAAEPEIAYRRAGDEARSVALVTNRTGKVRFDRLRALVADLQGHLDAEADRVNDQTRRSADLANAIVVASAMLALLLAAALSTQVQRRVLGPLRRLRPRAEAAARDPRSGQVPIPTGDPDVRAVARSAEQLRRTAVRNEESAARAQQALAQEAPSVAAISAELAPTAGALPAGLRWAGRTVPAEGDVPGDVYDVFAVSPQQVAVLVADAAGHGPQAGLVALRAKHVLAGAVRHGLDPAGAVARLAEELGDTGEGFLSVFLATVDLPGGALRYASAGHPAAVLLSTGAVERLPPTGPLLGPVPGRWATASAVLPPHGTLAVTTDGVSGTAVGEARVSGVERLVEHLGDATRTTARAEGSLDLGSVIDAVLADPSPAAGPARARPQDDRTVVLLHRPAHAAADQQWTTLPAVPASAGAARRLLRETVPPPGDDLLEAAELCLTELVTNAVLHGGGTEIAVSLALEQGVLRLGVRDRSDSHPRLLVHSASAGTGRGLALVAELSERWGSDPSPAGGKVVWCELTEESAGRGAGAGDAWLADLAELLDADLDADLDAGLLDGVPRDGTGPDDAPPRAAALLLRYPVRLGMRAREHYRSLLRECQLRVLHAPRDADAAATRAAAELLADVYTRRLRVQDVTGGGPGVEDTLLAAFTRGDRTADLLLSLGERPEELLAAAAGALDQVRRATATGELLTERTPSGVAELDAWAIEECERQLAGRSATPWPGPLD